MAVLICTSTVQVWIDVTDVRLTLQNCHDLRPFRTDDVRALTQFFLNALLESIYGKWPYVLQTACTNSNSFDVAAHSISIDSVSKRTF